LLDADSIRYVTCKEFMDLFQIHVGV
jgi:hypothetical protein